jgi:hypothetical protein
MSDEYELERVQVQKEAIREALQSYVEELFDGAEGSIVTNFVVVAEVAYADESFLRLCEIQTDIPTWHREGMLHSALFDPAHRRDDE